MNQYAKNDGESRIHVLIPLSSIVLKMIGTAKLTSHYSRSGIVYSLENCVNRRARSASATARASGQNNPLTCLRTGQNNEPSVLSDTLRRFDETKFFDCLRPVCRTFNRYRFRPGAPCDFG